MTQPLLYSHRHYRALVDRRICLPGGPVPTFLRFSPLRLCLSLTTTVLATTGDHSTGYSFGGLKFRFVAPRAAVPDSGGKAAGGRKFGASVGERRPCGRGGGTESSCGEAGDSDAASVARTFCWAPYLRADKKLALMACSLAALRDVSNELRDDRAIVLAAVELI